MKQAKGKELDSIAIMYGLKRRVRFLFIKESDDNLRLRVKTLIHSLNPVHIPEVGWNREGLSYVARLEYHEGRVKHTFVRTLDFISYHLINLIHGPETLKQMANRRH